MKYSRYLFFLVLCYTNLVFSFGQPPANYYDSAEGQCGITLQAALYEIICDHKVVTYASLWQHFHITDCRNDTIIDIYSSDSSGSAGYFFMIHKHQCKSVGKGEGDSYNREHLFCQSWFGKNKGAPYSDLFHIYPVDGYINSVRGNAPFGKVEDPTRTFSNGSRYGKNCYPESPGKNALEPADEYKGDIARSFFYMATRYLFEDDDFPTHYPMTCKSQLKPWALDMLIEWHLRDPVSEKERSRNNAVYSIQYNRNPFIDYPELVGMIWGQDSLCPFLP